MPVYRLENTIQPYPWGSRTAIADLLGLASPSSAPQAELWMGAHPQGTSLAVVGGTRMPLSELIVQNPVDILGESVAQHFQDSLPYLFKVLAAARPLSIQAHPNKSQAKEGYAREEMEGKPVSAPDRNYRDANHKPEIICALTPFWGLNGFRSAKKAISLLAPICPAVLEKQYQDWKNAGVSGVKTFFVEMMSLSADQRDAGARDIREKAEPLADSSPVYQWIVKLAEAYPADMGILSPALLNLICLAPGQAMYLPAGQLHAYLDGVGIELMANSDNVLRGGLTPKHVDVNELMQVVRFEETVIEVIRPRPLGLFESVYDCPATEFVLTVLDLKKQQPYRSKSIRSVEILLCTTGSGDMQTDNGEQIEIKKGDSLLIPANMGPYTIKGKGTFYKAAVPF